MRNVTARFLIVCLATLVSTLFAAAGVEVWVRLSWLPSRGTPGLLVADARRVEKLAAGYSGWFRGVPVSTNNLGFRDTRDYTIAKAPGTFRILVFGDSVTFGDGSIFDSTYPLLLERQLKGWRPDVDWQVWNLGVPGYNIDQELSYVEEVGERYRPDLVVVGVFVNDLFGNGIVRSPTMTRRAVSAIKSMLKTRLYSFDLYKKLYLQASFSLSASETYRQLLANLAREEALLKAENASELKEQAVTVISPMADRHARQSTCDEVLRSGAATAVQSRYESLARIVEEAKQNVIWTDRVEKLKRFHTEGRLRMVFFINIAPDECEPDDLFYRGGSELVNEYFLELFGDGVPTVSSFDAFYRYRPSDVPLAGGHSLANANAVKAATLFNFLRDEVMKDMRATGRRSSAGK